MNETLIAQQKLNKITFQELKSQFEPEKIRGDLIILERILECPGTNLVRMVYKDIVVNGPPYTARCADLTIFTRDKSENDRIFLSYLIGMENNLKGVHS